MALRNSSSRKRWTWFSVSLISPKGDTLPGSNPKYLIILLLLFGESFIKLSQGEMNGGALIAYAVYGLAGLVMVVPGIAVCVRRLHDTGKSGYYFFLSFIPFVGPLILFILCCAKGKTKSRHAKFGTLDGVFLCLYVILLISLIIWFTTHPVG